MFLEAREVCLRSRRKRPSTENHRRNKFHHNSTRIAQRSRSLTWKIIIRRHAAFAARLSIFAAISVILISSVLEWPYKGVPRAQAYRSRRASIATLDIAAINSAATKVYIVRRRASTWLDAAHYLPGIDAA